MTVVISNAAWSDMLAIARSIAADNPGRASTFIDDLYQCCVTLDEMPRAYAVVPRYAALGVRKRVYDGYLIFYRETNGRIAVLRVIHGARDYDRILSKTPSI